jgi:hypothetical protein
MRGGRRPVPVAFVDAVGYCRSRLSAYFGTQLQGLA